MIKRSHLLISDRLSTRVFMTIWLSIAIMILLTVLIPRFDQRRILPLKTEEATYNQEHYVNRLVMGEIITRQESFFSQFYGQQLHIRGRQLVIIPDDIERRYSAIHRLNNSNFANFIIRTIGDKRPSQQSIDKNRIAGPFHVELTPDYHYYLIGPAPPQAYYLSRLFRNPPLLILLMTFISIPFVMLLTWSLSKPMGYFRRAAERVAEGDWSVDERLERGPIEFRTVGKSFNRMVEALTNAENEKNRLFANLSHELRTPLTRIRLTNSLLRRKASKTLQPEVQRIEDNLILIEDRIQAMLSLSRELMVSRAEFETLNLQELLTPLLEDAQFEAKANQIDLTYNEIPAVTLALSSEAFASGLENILRNAIYYAKSLITVQLTLRLDWLIITIKDDGPGVNNEDLPHLFEAFYRGERPEGLEDYGGSGLGLSIAKQMVQIHKGEIEAKNDQGLSITLKFPLFKPTHKRLKGYLQNKQTSSTPLTANSSEDTRHSA